MRLEAEFLDRLNHASAAEFAAMLSGLYPDAPWLPATVAARRPFAAVAQFKHALARAVREADPAAQDALIGAHAAALPRPLPGDGPGPLPGLEAEYGRRFGFPFVLAGADDAGAPLAPSRHVAALERRLRRRPEVERAEALRQLHRTAELRLAERYGLQPAPGLELLAMIDTLAAESEPGFAERGELTVTYLSQAHRACAARIARWMEEAGFDDVSEDAVGNIVGVYHGTDTRGQRLLAGSHYDTVRNAGRYDGRLGVLAPLLLVRDLNRQRRRLPFGIELVAFAEEEGQRYHAVFLGSSAIAGTFDAHWLDQADAGGVTMRGAMAAAGLDPGAIAAVRRDPGLYLGYVEIHIEQGPVLNRLDLPLGVVTSINGSRRHVGEYVGQASHAGTTPMGERHDAALAAAELALALERSASERPQVVGTMGMLEVPGASINVVPGRCRFSLDIRAPDDVTRDACVDEVLAEARRIARCRGVELLLDETLCVAAAPSDPSLQRRWESAVARLGLPVHRMPSGAGHDAMKLHAVMPQAMLFVRGGNDGISHNPLESVTADDAELALRALQQLVEDWAAEA